MIKYFLLIVLQIGIWPACTTVSKKKQFPPEHIITKHGDTNTAKQAIYGINSAILNYTNKNDNSDITIYFDSYGARQAIIFSSRAILANKTFDIYTRSLIMEGYLYSINDYTKCGTRMKYPYSGSEVSTHFDINQLSKHQREVMELEEEQPTEILNRKCRVYSFYCKSDKLIKYHVWRNIVMRSEIDGEVNLQINTLAENPKVASKLFDIPNNYKITNY